MVKISGKSESDFVREIVMGAVEKESKSYNSGFMKGVNKFILPCSICGKDMLFDIDKGEEIRQKIIDMFGTYAHNNCIKKKQEGL